MEWTPLRVLIAATLPSVLLVFLAAPLAASRPGYVSEKTGVAVCWEAGDTRYAEEIYRAQALWNQFAGKTLILDAASGACTKNFTVETVLKDYNNILATTWNGFSDQRGQTELYVSEIEECQPRCGRWAAVHEFGHALGLKHSKNRRAVMYPTFVHWKRSAPDYPSSSDRASFDDYWGNGPRGYSSEKRIARERPHR